MVTGLSPRHRGSRVGKFLRCPSRAPASVHAGVDLAGICRHLLSRAARRPWAARSAPGRPWSVPSRPDRHKSVLGTGQIGSVSGVWESTPQPSPSCG